MKPDRLNVQPDFRLLADNVPALFAFVDAEERYLFVNERYQEAYDKSREDFIGKTIRETVGEESYALVREQIAAALAGERVEFEVAFPRPTGGPLWLSAIHVPHRDESGDLDGFYALATDVSARREAEELLRQQRNTLAHALRIHTAGELATTWAHEVTQPLNAIANYVDACARWMRSGKADQERLLGILEDASEQALRAGRIVHRVRDFVRAEEPVRKPADLRDLARGACGLVEAQARNGSIDLEVELCCQPLPVYCDHVQIQQACMNLLENAIEAMAEVEPASRRLEVRTAPGAGDFCEVTIRDQGIGVGERAGPLPFDSFHTTKPGGLGLGLSITKSIVEAHGGEVSLSARTDGVRGSIARVRLPQRTENEHVE